MSEGRMEQEIDRQISCSNAVNVLVCCGEEGAELEGKALDLPVDLHSSSHLWPWTLDHGGQDEIPDTSGQNELSLNSGRMLPLESCFICFKHLLVASLGMWDISAALGTPWDPLKGAKKKGPKAKVFLLGCDHLVSFFFFFWESLLDIQHDQGH